MGSLEALINKQLRRWELEQKKRTEDINAGLVPAVRPIITISRQKGSGGAYFAEQLAERLKYQLLYREVIDEICNSSGYRRQIIESIDDKVRSRIELWMAGLFSGAMIDSSDYFKQLFKVISTIAEHGGVIVVGRGANFIIPAGRGFSIRVVASLSRRIENLMRVQNLTHEQAEKEIKRVDRERSDFIKSNFKRDIDEPGVYDLVINTTNISIETAIKIAEEGIRARWDISGN
jgi:cytidylate kinase